MALALSLFTMDEVSVDHCLRPDLLVFSAIKYFVVVWVYLFAVD
jgi:hypothetical protein